MATARITGVSNGEGKSSVTEAIYNGSTKDTLPATARNLLNRILPPQTREELKSRMTKFITEKPVLASFIVSQIAVSGIPLVFFFVLVVTVGIFALLAGIVAGIVAGIIGALTFAVFALMLALFVLLPTLFVTTLLAVTIWSSTLAIYYIAKQVKEKRVPGVHVSLKEGLLEQPGLKDGPVLSGKGPLATSNPAQHSPLNGRSVSNRSHNTAAEITTPATTTQTPQFAKAIGGGEFKHYDGKHTGLTTTPLV